MQFWHDLLEGTITSQMLVKTIRRMKYVEHVQHWIKNLEELGNHFSKYFGQFNSLISLHNSDCTTTTKLPKSTVHFASKSKILCVREPSTQKCSYCQLLLTLLSSPLVFEAVLKTPELEPKAWILSCLITTCHSFSNRCSFMNCLRNTSVNEHNRSSKSWQMAEFTK